MFLSLCLSAWRGKKISGWPSVCGKKAAMKVIHRGVSRDPGPKLITTSSHFWIPMTESVELRSLDGAQQSRCDCNFSLLRPSATTPRLPALSVIGTEVVLLILYTVNNKEPGTAIEFSYRPSLPGLLFGWEKLC